MSVSPQSPSSVMHTQVSESASRPMRAFLSFATEDKPLVEAFRRRLGHQQPEIEFLDHAVSDHYDEDWKRECARKIDRSELLICLVGATTHRSQAVAWEIHRGLSRGKRIVAVKLTTGGVRVPEVLARNAIEPQQSIAGIALSSETAPVFEREANGPTE